MSDISIQELWGLPYDPEDDDARAEYLESVSEAHREWQDAHAASIPFDRSKADPDGDYELGYLDVEATPEQDADLARRVEENWQRHRIAEAATAALKHAAHNQKDHGRRYRERHMTAPVPYTDKMVAESLKHFERNNLTAPVQAANLERILDRTPPSTVEAGKLWYPGARAEAKVDADELGYPLHTSIGIYAANAQNAEWADGPWRNGRAPASYTQPAARNHMEIMRGMHGDRLNIRREDSERMWNKEINSTSGGTRNNAVKAWDYDGIETDKHGMNFTGRGIPLNDLPSDLVLRHHPKAAALYEVRTRSARLARGEHPDDVLIGAKLRSFHNNILDPEERRFVTLDRWAVRAAADNPAYPKGKAGLHLANRARYEYMARPVRAIAEDRDLVPNQVQAITWLKIREEGGDR